jgi:hypothetical protein
LKVSKEDLPRIVVTYMELEEETRLETEHRAHWKIATYRTEQFSAHRISDLPRLREQPTASTHWRYPFG